MIASMSQGKPMRWTAITAFVFGVMSFSISEGMISCEFKSTSATIGVAPRMTIELADAMNVRHGTITSSPAPTPKPSRASSRAVVPLLTAIANFAPV